MDRLILDVIEYSGEGYKPLIDFGSWRVAFLRYLDELYPPSIAYMERHLQTDEVFVLLAGEAVLLLGGNEKGRVASPLEVVKMEAGKLYNVKMAAWHGVVLSRDATILLVENADTGLDNSEHMPLTKTMLAEYLQAAHQLKDWADLGEEALV